MEPVVFGQDHIPRPGWGEGLLWMSPPWICACAHLNTSAPAGAVTGLGQSMPRVPFRPACAGLHSTRSYIQWPLWGQSRHALWSTELLSLGADHRIPNRLVHGVALWGCSIASSSIYTETYAYIHCVHINELGQRPPILSRTLVLRL